MKTNGQKTYGSVARHFHWWTFALVAILFPLGVAMYVRGTWLNIWDTLTNSLFSTHKLLGFALLCLTVARLAYRLAHGGPDDEPTLETWQKRVSHVTHWAIYALLLAVPLAGWIGVQLYPALDIFGLFSLPAFLSPDPAFLSPDNARSGLVLGLHGILALALFVLLGMHVGAALFHYVIRKDGVLNRMIPVLPPAKRN